VAIQVKQISYSTPKEMRCWPCAVSWKSNSILDLVREIWAEKEREKKRLQFRGLFSGRLGSVITCTVAPS
jgi:hypothetical protein